MFIYVLLRIVLYVLLLISFFVLIKFLPEFVAKAKLKIKYFLLCQLSLRTNLGESVCFVLRLAITT